MDVIQLRKVCKFFGALRAVDDLSLSVPRGCIYGFIGPNDSGKTTTLRMLMSILRPDTGDTQKRLHELLARTEVHHFEQTRPSLHDIFVRIAKPQPDETDEEEVAP